MQKWSSARSHRPRVAQPLIDEVSVALPPGIGLAGPQVGDFIEATPCFGCHWDESRTRPTGERESVVACYRKRDFGEFVMVGFQGGAYAEASRLS